MAHARPFLVLLLMIVAFATPALAQDPNEDPRDREMREMKRRLEVQERQIQELQDMVRQLMPAAAAPPAGSEEPEDPGPEPPPPAPAQPQVGTSGTGQQPQLNPNISVIGLFEGQGGGRPEDAGRNTFSVREVEIALQAPIDPSAKLDAFVSFPRNESPELEEAYGTLLDLPYGLQARAGLFRNDFGRINPLHTHALPQIDRPLPVEEFFGEEGLRSPGVEASWLAPLPWYSRASVQVTSRFGEAEDGAFALFPDAGVRKPLFLGRLENLFDLDEDTTLMFGLSGATSEIQDGVVDDARIGGADMTLKWSPLDNPNKQLTWQTEFLAGRQAFADPTLGSNSFDGWYSFLNYRWNRNWRAGVRYDESDIPLAPGQRQRRSTALLEFINSEWNSIRLQFSRYNPNFDQPYNEFRVQWNVVIGPHGAHKY